MAVMTSSAFDKVPLDLKPNGFAPADAMALDMETNGVHDVLFDEPDSQPAEEPAAQAKPTVNGNHVASDTSAIAPTTNVSSGMDGIAQFLPDSQPESKSLLDGSDLGATSVTNAVEAPTSDVRDEAAPETQSTQQVPETQIPPKSEDAMDISNEATAATDSTAPPTNSMTELSIQTQQSVSTPTQTTMTQSPTNMDHSMDEAPASGKVRPREDDEDDGPDAKRTKTEDEAEGPAQFKVPQAPVISTAAPSEQTNGAGVTPVTPVAPTADQSGIHKAVTYEDWPSTPITNNQSKFLLERIRNTKKIKVSLAFKEPVNAELLNIPHYYDLIKNPMDLTTMETKLKEGKYPGIREFMADLDQMVENSEIFNGKEHPVTQAGYNMRAYFLKGMGKMPRLGDEEPAKQAKVKKPTVATSAKPRRESRAVPTPTSATTVATAKSPTAPIPTPTTAASPQSAWPLGADGMPLIRRDSSTANDRPKREIHRPPSKDLPYTTAKPRKKKYQQELKFCEGVISELMKPKHGKFAYPFVTPVDPVALNIPSYLKIIKKPMDFGTIEKNLKAGAYQSAKDFYNDAQLVFANCYKFNPEGDEVNKMGKQLNELFDTLWKEKADWLAQHAPASEQSPGDYYSDEEEEEEEEEEEDPAHAQFLAIQQQIAALNETAQQLLQQQKGKRTSPKVPAKKKSKTAAPKKKSTAPLSVPPPMKAGKPKARVKAPAPLSFTQKQEISEGISTLGDAEMRKAVQIIRNGCPHLANTNDDEMELDMDEINDETLRELFKFIKSVRGPKGVVAADDDFEPPRQIHKQTTSRPKKNKPMGKSEQEDNLRKIQEKMQSFSGAVSGSSQSPPPHDDSSDDESSGSESEEE